ncbi:MAG TPA: 2-succinyl-5-enolpyruvyl-6-hydroxy-3-cyclohexene-1-carboxylic-acid synthase [Bacteroidales bacterium]|jgi:2-succinyl-5-enolpyruvyl-6-hydroxy-3-cyclohexene-1-carboxylate synthase|nr:2-succinyl-5-enolpyruvyl-6-hydroxy-3-cyclohexene-1-carboxylic-acid synthase [Bacteroidales bacterium]
MIAKSHIAEIASVLKAQGVARVIIAPGSRNAPLIQAFTKQFPGKCTSIVDERSAAYFALGVALKTQNPAVVITTSGTAALNLAPAMAEAFHQGIPLIAVTADRPAEWIDQQDNQSIRQQHIFSANSKGFFELPIESNTDEDVWLSNRIANQAFNLAIHGKPGPVHINVPLREPLYEVLPVHKNARIIHQTAQALPVIDTTCRKKWNSAKGIFIVCGQSSVNENLQEALNHLAFDSRVLVLAEAISNIHGENILHYSDFIFQNRISEFNFPEPDLVVYFGGQIISKGLKDYLRGLKHSDFWFISPEGTPTDTFQRLNTVYTAFPESFFQQLFECTAIVKDSDFALRWNNENMNTRKEIADYTEETEYSDLWVFNQLQKAYKPIDIIFAGNSSVVRYIQYYECFNALYSNRGTSGIDGCVSTAAGIASESNSKVVAIVGDLSFVYDSNGLWNRALPENLKIVVINNQGGGIFSMIPGPDSQQGFKDYFEAHHPVSIQKIAEAFGLDYFSCENAEQFSEVYGLFYSGNTASVLEICTNTDVNTTVFRNFVQRFKYNK